MFIQVNNLTKIYNKFLAVEIPFAKDANRTHLMLILLSPLTEMARRFHIRNGAKFIGKSDTCQNFEYDLC